MTFDYEVAYSARKTVCVRISSENKITVRCPYGFKKQKIEEILQKKSAWIIKHLTANSVKNESNADLISYEVIMIKGEKLPLITGNVNRISDGAVRIKNLKCVKKLYCDTFSEEFAERVKYFCGLTGLVAASVKFKSYTARWGCCDARNNIVFNYKLLMLDEALWDYVVIHELCHIKYRNHSAQFWRLVETYMPDYRVRRKRLKSFDFITSLY